MQETAYRIKASRLGVLYTLASPFIIFAFDALVRLYLATLLELYHYDSTRAAALPAALLGAARDLVWVLPVYALWALRPQAITRHITHTAIAAALVVLATDLVYFYVTFEHVEPVLFVNFNWLSIRGMVGWRESGWIAAGVAVVVMMLRVNYAALARAERSGNRELRVAAVALAGGVIGLPLVCPMPHWSEQFLPFGV